jgi:hypothetical protein
LLGERTWGEYLLLAQSGHADTLDQCPLLGVKRTFAAWLQSNTGRIFAPFNGELIACHFHAHLP